MTEAMLVRVVYRGGLVLLAVVAVVLIFLELKWVIVQLFAAAIVAAGMAPVVAPLTDAERTRGWRWRPPPVLVVLLIYLVVGVVVLVVGSVLLQTVLSQAAALVQRAPEFAVALQNLYTQAAERWTVLEEVDVFGILGGTSGLTQSIVGILAQVLNVAGLLLAVFGGALNVIFVLFMALYLTLGGRQMLDYSIVFVPRARQPQVRRVVANISGQLGRWVLGELELVVIIGLGAGIGLGLIGVPGAALLALVWGVSELIPGIGPFISGVPTIVLGFVAGPTTGILATIFTFVWSQIENNVMVPRVMSRAVKLNPLVVLVALLAGNQLIGLAGALFAIPAAAAAAVVVDELRHERLLAEQEPELEFDAAALTRR